MATNGLVVMTPTSIAYSGTSASINSDGSVDFSAVTSLSLNGVFTSDYDNYMVAVRMVGTVDGDETYWRFRASGSDNSTASSYVTQYIQASSTSVAGVRTTANYARVMPADNENRAGNAVYVYGPYLAQPTAARSVTSDGNVGALIRDAAFTHNQSVSYDGFTLSLGFGGNISGLVTVFGFNQ